jgi:4-amino-4-deoxy-L-arabinose transferase-like glycosyltransferase
MTDQQMTAVGTDMPRKSFGPTSGPAANSTIVALLIGAGALVRILSYFYSQNAGGDAWARLGLAAQWLQHPSFKVMFDVYPPGQFWLIGLVHLFVPDVTIAGRLLSLILGIASLPVVWKLGTILYGEESGILGLAVFAFYSIHVGYSSTSSGEASFLFFLLAALTLFFSWFEDRQLWRVALSGIALSVSELIRIESWVIFFAMAALLLVYVSRAGVKNLGEGVVPFLTFTASGAVGPVFLMAYCWIVFHDPKLVLSLHDVLLTELMKRIPVTLSHQLAVTPVTLLITMSPVAFFAAIYGWFKSLRLPLPMSYAAITLFFILVQHVEILRGKLLAIPRYTLTVGAMLAVIAGYGLHRLCLLVGPTKQKLAQSVVIVLLLLNLAGLWIASEVPSRFSEKLASLSPRLRYADRISEVGGYLRTHLPPQGSVIIDNYNEESNIIARAAGLPLLPGDRAFLANVRNRITPLEYVAEQHPQFLVYSDSGTLHQWLNLPSSCDAESVETIDGVHYRCVRSGSVYRIYQITYQ